MRKKLAILMALAMLLNMVSGCGTKGTDTIEESAERLPNLIFTVAGTDASQYDNPAWLETKPQETRPSNLVDVHLFIDGSSSMRGYLAYSGSTYDRMVTSLPSVCINAFESYIFNSYKVFDEVHLMKDSANDFLPIGEDYVDYVYEQDFYGSETGVRTGDVNDADKTRCDYTKIIEQIETINPRISNGGGAGNDLYIIVSDFIPQSDLDTDFYRFNTKLYSEIICQDLCCGIAGFKSEFYGDIQCLDIQGKKTSFAYSGDMPFYIVVIGETRNVTQFMSALEERTNHFELSNDEYGIFITDGQSPKNTGEGDVATVAWQGTLHEEQAAAQSTDAMVSYELVHSDAYKKGDMLTYPLAYNIFPMNRYIEADPITNGEIRFKLPYALSPASSVDIADENWIITYDYQVIQGETAVKPSDMEVIAEGCSSNISLPEDMSLEAFEYIYLPRLPKGRRGQTEEDIQKETWQKRSDEYLKGLAARTVCADDMFVSMAEGYVQNGEVVIPISFDTEMMTSEMPYLISVTITAEPKITTRAFDGWIGEWNMENDAFSDWIEDPQSQSAGKTPGLSRAFKALQGDRIYDDGCFLRQVNLIVSNGELLADAEVKLWAQQQAAKAQMQEADAKQDAKETVNAGKKFSDIFNIFKKGDE
ncbi:MAG: hypothetical protein AB1Z19_01555 [Eubacteriales bacterium]